MFKHKVTINNDIPKANAAWVFGTPNAWSPIKMTTICAVIVEVDSNGFKVKFAANQDAITTIIVSPIAIETPNNIDLTIPGTAAGKITFLIVSDLVAPMA